MADGGDVAIPVTIEGLPVTVIGECAFNNKWTLKNVTTPQSVTTIGAAAFSRCSNSAALLETLSPGKYTVFLMGEEESQGIGLIEVYQSEI